MQGWNIKNISNFTVYVNTLTGECVQAGSRLWEGEEGAERQMMEGSWWQEQPWGTVLCGWGGREPPCEVQEVTGDLAVWVLAVAAGSCCFQPATALCPP